MERNFLITKSFVGCLAAVSLAWSALISEAIPPSTQGNLLQDLNHDGQLDAIQLEFVSSISPEYLQNVLDSVVLTWPDSAGNLLRLVTLGSDFELDPNRSRRLIRRFPAHLPIARQLTYRGAVQYPFTYGLASYYAAGNLDPLPIRIEEALLPVIIDAKLNNGQNRDPDTIRITLSEPVYLVNRTTSPLLEIRHVDSATSWPLVTSLVHWIDQNHLYMLVSSDHKPRPLNGDSVRIMPAVLQDAVGNVAQLGQNKYQVLQGRFPFNLLVQPMATVTTASWHDRPLFQVDFMASNDSILPQDWLGIGMDFGSSNLEAAIQSKLSGSQRFAPLDPSKIKWSLDLKVYSNDGQPVHHSSMQINCADPRFLSEKSGPTLQGDCLENPAKVFLRWNLRTNSGRSVANGAYIALINSHISYAGTVIHSISPGMQGGTAVWGVMRRTNGTH